jgi:subtilisin family serine protease
VGTIEGKLSDSSAITIPSLHVTAADGQKLINLAVGETLTIEKKMGYGYLSGTSMAVPHVTGVIAKIWRAVSNSSPFNLCVINIFQIFLRFT